MTEPKTTCTQCGCSILQRTADRNGGLCSPCSFRKFPRKLPPVLPVTRAILDELILSQPRDVVIDALFDVACDKLGRPAEMSEGDIIVYTIWTFLGEALNGGLIQYLTNPSGQWAHQCGPSLHQIGAHPYADVIERCIAMFTSATSAQDPQWEADLDDFWEEHDEPFEELEAVFFQYYHEDKNELPDLLFKYICQNRDVFAPFAL